MTEAFKARLIPFREREVMKAGYLRVGFTQSGKGVYVSFIDEVKDQFAEHISRSKQHISRSKFRRLALCYAN